MALSPTTQALATDLRVVVTRLVKRLRTHSPTREQLSLTERAVLLLLDQHPHLLPSDLAAREKVTAQSMSQILRHLEARGYVTRQPAPDDRRKVLMSISDTGRDLLQTVRQERDEWLQHVLATCSATELASLRQALPILSRLVEIG